MTNVNRLFALSFAKNILGYETFFTLLCTKR